MLGLLSGFGLKGWLIAGGLSLLVGGGIFAYHWVSTSWMKSELEAKDAKIATLNKNIADLETSNKTLALTLTTLGDQLQRSLEYSRDNANLLNSYATNAANAETAVRSTERQTSRRNREASGDAEGVLSEDRLQLYCLWSHFGSITGRCVNGAWVIAQ